MAYSDTILATTGLLSYWQLNEAAGTSGSGSVHDSNGTNHGTPTSVTFGATGLLNGDSATSASFPTTPVGISMGNVSALNFDNVTPFSAEAWINPTTAISGTTQTIVGKWHNGTVSTDGWVLMIDSAGHLRLQRWLAGALQEKQHSAVLSNTTTYYVTGTFDGSTISVAVNAGTAETAAPAPTQNIDSANTANFGIGGFNANTFYYWGGRLEHVAVYSSVLSSGTITAHYNAGLNPPGYVAPFPGVFNLDARRFF